MSNIHADWASIPVATCTAMQEYWMGTFMCHMLRGECAGSRRGGGKQCWGWTGPREKEGEAAFPFCMGSCAAHTGTLCLMTVKGFSVSVLDTSSQLPACPSCLLAPLACLLPPLPLFCPPIHPLLGLPPRPQIHHSPGAWVIATPAGPCLSCGPCGSCGSCSPFSSRSPCG